MPLVRGDKEYLIPINGLNTEATPLKFPEQSAADLLNVQMDYDPLRMRVRKGVEVESGVTGTFVDAAAPLNTSTAYTMYRWERVGNDASRNFIVVQLGNILYFHDADATNVTDSRKTYIIDLLSAKSGTAEGTDALVKTTRVQFQNVKGRLIVVSRAIDPTFLYYDESENKVKATVLTLQVRDTIGLDDGLAIDVRPVSLSEAHAYNLYNQGWYQKRRKVSAGGYIDPVVEFDAVNGVYPSNADIVWIGMVEDNGDLIFDPEWLKDQTFGSSPAPRGHYILDAFDMDRDAIRLSPTTGTGRWGGYTGTGGGYGGGGGGGGAVIPDDDDIFLPIPFDPY